MSLWHMLNGAGRVLPHLAHSLAYVGKVVMRRLSRRPLLAFVVFVALVLVSGATSPVAAAHPLGNFSVNRYCRIEAAGQNLRLRYVLDMAEIPTFQELPRLDGDGDKVVSADEIARYADTLGARLARGLLLSADGRRLPLTVDEHSAELRPGQAGLQTLYVRVDLQASLPQGEGPWQLSYEDTVFADRVGWREVVVRAADGSRLLASSAPAEDISRELTSYPEDLLQTPLAANTASFRVALGAVAATPNDASAITVPASRPGDDRLAALVQMPVSGPLSLGLTMLAALALGAAHALAPGHGKTIVAAYLVGARGTVAHAVFLGLTTTITHTAGVFALGLITLFVAEFVLPEQLYPWLGALSGLLVFGLGAALLRQRILGIRQAAHERRHAGQAEAEWHSHGFGYHRHAAQPADPTSWRSLLALGVAGGLLPCPSALVVLLGSLALGRPQLGLLLVLCFSLGLAGVLTAVGVLLVKARGLFVRLPAGGALLRGASLAGAALVTVAGLLITVQALAETGLLRL